MATATKQSRANRQVPRRAGGRSAHFLAFEDNGRDYCWPILASGGGSVGHARPYPTPDDAAHAARDGAGSELSSEAVTQ